MEAAALEEVKQNVREAIVTSMDDGIARLREVLPANRPKHRQLLLLRGRLNGLVEYRVNNTLAPDKILVLENELRQDILLFTEHLTLTDFAEAPAGRPELKPGHLLYQIPDRMKVRERHACRVRIAHRLSQLLKDLDPTVHHEIEDIPVAEVMEVEIIDPSDRNDPAFNVLLVSDGEQFIDEYSYTEWVFYVRPLKPGPQELVLKVSVLITVGGKERTKNLVFTRSIEVGAEAETAPPLRRVEPAAPSSGGVLEELGELDDHYPPPIQGRFSPKEPRGSAPVVMPAPAPPPRGANAPRRDSGPWLKIAAAVVFLVVATFLLIPTGKDISRIDPVTPADGNVDQIIVTRLNTNEVTRGQQWEGTRERLLKSYRENPDQQLVITGHYYPDEPAPPGYENMGELRAEKIRALLEADIPRDKMETRTILKDKSSLTGDKLPEAGSFQWRNPEEVRDRRDDRMKFPSRSTSPQRLVVPKDTASTRRKPSGQ